MARTFAGTWRTGLVSALLLTSVAAAPAMATTAPRTAAIKAAAVTPACSPWGQLSPGVWAAVCVGTSNGLTSAWAEMRNNSGQKAQMSGFVYIKNNALPTAVCGGYPSWWPAGAVAKCAGPWHWVPSQRWARGDFWANGVSKTLYTPSLP